MNKQFLLKSILVGTFAVLSTFGQADTPDTLTLDSIVAIANDDIITASEVNTRLLRIKQQYQANPQVLPNEKELRRQILDTLILESLQLQMAARGNLIIPEQNIDDTLSRIAQNQKMNLAQLTLALKNEGRTIESFREQIRNELTINEIRRKVVGKNVLVTSSEIDRYLNSQAGQTLQALQYQLYYQRFELSENTIANDTLAKLNNGELLSSIEGSKDLGMRTLADIPSIFKTLVPVLEVSEAILVEENNALHLAQLVQKTDVKSVNIEEYNIRHILIKSDALLNKESAKSLLADIKSQIEAGASMSDLADQYSDDVGTKGSGGSLGWNTLDNYVPEFGTAARSVDVNELSDVFESPFGFHILIVEEVRTRDVGLDVLRNQIRNQFTKKRFEESLQRWLTELKAESYIEYRQE